MARKDFRSAGINIRSSKKNLLTPDSERTAGEDRTGIMDEGGAGGKPPGTKGSLRGTGIDTNSDNVIDRAMNDRQVRSAGTLGGKQKKKKKAK